MSKHVLLPFRSEPDVQKETRHDEGFAIGEWVQVFYDRRYRRGQIVELFRARYDGKPWAAVEVYDEQGLLAKAEVRIGALAKVPQRKTDQGECPADIEERRKAI